MQHVAFGFRRHGSKRREDNNKITTERKRSRFCVRCHLDDEIKSSLVDEEISNNKNNKNKKANW